MKDGTWVIYTERWDKFSNLIYFTPDNSLGALKDARRFDTLGEANLWAVRLQFNLIRYEDAVLREFTSL